MKKLVDVNAISDQKMLQYLGKKNFNSIPYVHQMLDDAKTEFAVPTSYIRHVSYEFRKKAAKEDDQTVKTVLLHIADVLDEVIISYYEKNAEDKVEETSARWITVNRTKVINNQFISYKELECSACKHRVSADARSNYCPCCGAKMEEKEDD